MITYTYDHEELCRLIADDMARRNNSVPNMHRCEIDDSALPADVLVHARVTNEPLIPPGSLKGRFGALRAMLNDKEPVPTPVN